MFVSINNKKKREKLDIWHDIKLNVLGNVDDIQSTIDNTIQKKTTSHYTDTTLGLTQFHGFLHPLEQVIPTALKR